MSFIQTSIPLNNVGQVLVQFRLTEQEWRKFNLENLVPKGTGKKEKKQQKRGRKFLLPTENTIVFSCNEGLFSSYKLADAFYDETQKGGYMVQFTFVKNNVAKLSAKFKKEGVRCLDAFNKLRRKTVWQTQGYVNPCEEAGKEMVAINCRQPVYKKVESFTVPSLFAFSNKIGLLSVFP